MLVQAMFLLLGLYYIILTHLYKQCNFIREDWPNEVTKMNGSVTLHPKDPVYLRVDEHGGDRLGDAEEVNDEQITTK